MLQDAGLIEAWRGTDGGRPQTLYRLFTAEGRARFLAYLEELEQVVRDAAACVEEARALARSRLPVISPRNRT